MDEKVLEISFNIIGCAGDAKGLAMEAIKLAKSGNIAEAREKIEESRQGMVQAHKYQTQLVHAEANGEKTEMSVILVHAQDHLMTSMTFQQLADEIIDVYARLEEQK